MAAAIVVSEKMSPQAATLRLVVRMIEPFWYLREMTWNREAASFGWHGEIAEFVHYEHGWAGEEPHGGSPSAFEGGCWGSGLPGPRRWCSTPCGRRRPRLGPR